MSKKYADIIDEGKGTGKSVAEINAELAAAGADFHLAEDGAPVWSEQEMTEGFIPAEKEPEDVKHLRDYMKYDPAKAGLKLVVSVAEGRYEISWNENGNPIKAIKKD